MIQGSLVAIVTPMHADGSVDETAFRRLIDWHVEQGTDAIVAVGTTGESATLDEHEHCAAIALAVEQAAGRVPVIAGTGANSTSEAIALTRCALDVSGRPYLVWRVEFLRDKVGEMDTELFREFFQAFAQHAGITLHLETVYGENNHHIAESSFKALARALRAAVTIDERRAGELPSTKGRLGG